MRLNKLMLVSITSYHLPSHPPSIHNHRMPAHIRTRLTRQEHRRAPEVLGRAPPPGRDPLADAGQPLRVAQQRRVHVRLDVAGRDGVDRDPPGRPLVGEALGQLRHGALGRRVRRHGEAALEGEQRGEVDDAALAARHGRDGQVEHVRAGVAAEAEDGVEVDLDDLRAASVPDSVI